MQTIPLNLLNISEKYNVRLTGREQGLEELISSICERMNVAVAKDIRPTASNFFNKVTKAEVLEIGKEIFGDAWVNKHQAKTKGDIVAILHRAFENPEQKNHTKEQRTKLSAWLPDGM